MKSDHTRFLLIIIFLLITILTFFVIKPFIITLLTSAVLAFLCYPIHRWLTHKINRPTLNAVFLTLLIIIIIIIPTVVLINSAAREAVTGYTILRQQFVTYNCGNEESELCNFINKPSTKFSLQKAAEKTTSYIITKASDIAVSIPSVIINFFVMIFSLYYFLKDGEKIIEKIKGVLPYKAHSKEKLFTEMYNITYGIVYGTALVALIEAIIAWIAFTAAGINGALLWSMIIFILAFIPAIGPTIVSVPGTIILFVMGNYPSAAILLVMGILLSVIDNFVRPKIIGNRSNTHPVIILVGILGGIALLGIVGVVIGPLILALFFLLMQNMVNYETG